MAILARPSFGRASACLALAVLALALLMFSPPGWASSGATNLGTKGDAAFGEYLSGTCVTCHQATGKAAGGIPPIVAWPEDQFIAVMNAYRSKDRENLVMRTIAASLSDEEIAALAAYFGGLILQPETQK
jgi:cytochrome c